MVTEDDCCNNSCTVGRGSRAENQLISTDIALVGTGRALCRAVDGHSRRDHRERGAAVHPAEPRVLLIGPGLGGQCLSGPLRWPATACRAARRPHRAQARLRRRPGHVHGCLAAVRCGPGPSDAARLPVRPGHRRRGDLCRHPRHGRAPVPAAEGAGQGHRRLQFRPVRRRLDGPPRRRRPDADHQLALDLLRQRPDRHRGRAVGRTRAHIRAGCRPRQGNRCRGRATGHLRTEYLASTRSSRPPATAGLPHTR